MKNTVLILFVMLLISGNVFTQDFGYFNKQVLFDPMSSEFYIFRIPAIVTSVSGNILVFSEGRKGKGGDFDPSNIVYRLSSDSGESWTPISILADNGNTTCSNAVPIVDYFDNKIHLIYTVGYNKLFYTSSVDEGVSWDTTINITDVLEGFKSKYPWKVVATGPGHGTQLTTGRLIVPIWFSESKAIDSLNFALAHHPSIASVMYSDDFGKSWLVGDIIGLNNDTLIFPSEASCVELLSGEVLFNMRNESKNYRRLVSLSPDGTTNWSSPHYSDNFFEPICHASMIRYSIKPYQDLNRIIFTNPDSRMAPWSTKRGTTHNAAPKRQRSNLTLRLSYDEALTFPVYKEIDAGLTGYSDLAVSNNGIIHCLYETGVKVKNTFHPSEITLASFDLSWATNGKDALSINDMPLNSNLICAAEKQNMGPAKKKKHLFRKKQVRNCSNCMSYIH
ncbi:MAG: sialidase family protein [Bacteroidales bacterium]|nr:sialidase family protein [Bacteroidales bacterium]MDD4216951.1 sialidase family protein [Bacteroidales bacterium]MDY0140740.1 sialidase family protein [Bacteroidales bacterium]